MMVLTKFPLSSSTMHALIIYAFQTKSIPCFNLSLSLWKQLYSGIENGSIDNPVPLFTSIPNSSVLLKELVNEKDYQLQALGVRLLLLTIIESRFLSLKGEFVSLLQSLPMKNDFCYMIHQRLVQGSLSHSLFSLILQFAFYQSDYLALLCDAIPVVEEEDSLSDNGVMDIRTNAGEKTILIPAVLETIISCYSYLSQRMRSLFLSSLLMSQDCECISHIDDFLIEQMNLMLPCHPLIRRMFFVTHLKSISSSEWDDPLKAELLFLLRLYYNEDYEEKQSDELSDTIFRLIENDMQDVDATFLPLFMQLIAKGVASVIQHKNSTEDVFHIVSICLKADPLSNLAGFVIYLGIIEIMAHLNTIVIKDTER